MKKFLRVVLFLFAFLLLAGIGTYGWASWKTSSLLARTMETHRVDFPIPFPLSDEERAELTPDQDANAVALERAVERGRHLIESRYGCTECHGVGLGGGVMVDDPMLGRLLGPNLTTGEGSKTLTYGPADWDRAVRHGVKPDDHPSVMPSVDFERMSDQELSDIVAYIRSLPAVDSEVPPVRLGPIGRVLAATGQLPLSVDLIQSHNTPHVELPPTATVSEDFGRHLAGVCVGCHGADLAGGPIVGGDPSWPPARNLTPHADGLAGWTFNDFRRVLLDGTRPDGTEIQEPMANMRAFAENMTDVELEALWAYLQSVPPVASTE